MLKTSPNTKFYCGVGFNLLFVFLLQTSSNKAIAILFDFVKDDIDYDRHILMQLLALVIEALTESIKEHIELAG